VSRLFDPTAYAFNPNALLPIAATLALCALLIFLGVKPGEPRLRRAFALYTTLMLCWTGGLALIMSVNDSTLGLWLSRLTVGVLSFAGVLAIQFSIVLLRRALGPAWAALLGLHAGLAALTLTTGKIVAGVWQPPWGGRYAIAGPWFPLLVLAGVGELLLAAGMGLRAARRAHGLRRRQLLYVAASQLVGLLTALDVAGLYRRPRFPMAWLTVLLSMGLVFYSIAAHRLLGIRTVAHRSVGWAILSLLLIPPIFMIAHATGGLGFAHPVATAGVVLALFVGTRLYLSRLQPLLVRWQGGHRREALSELCAALGERAVGARSAEEVRELLAHTIRDGTHVEMTLLAARDVRGNWRTYPGHQDPPLRDVDPALAWLAGQDEPVTRGQLELLPNDELARAVAALLDRFGAEVVIPLRYGGEMVGILAVGAPGRPGHAQLDDEELAFVHTLARQSALALVNARLYEEVQRRSQGLEAEVRVRTDELARALEDLKHAQARLVHAERMSALGLLVAGVSHEINNALNFIYGNLPTLGRYVSVLDQLQAAYGARLPDGGAALLGDLFERARVARVELPRLAETIGQGAQQAHGMVEDLRRFARRGDDQSPRPYSVEEGLSVAVSLLRSRLRDPVKVVRRFQPGLPAIACHPTQINQVWIALLMNAAQAVAGQGTIEIEGWAQPAGFVTVIVRDTGCGIAGEHLARVFEPFFTTGRPGEAAGLGLTVARDVVLRHGGRIEAESAGPGQGATMRVTLPVGDAGV